jgi:hypothetical protein
VREALANIEMEKERGWTVDFNGGLNPGPFTQTSFPFIPSEVKSIS